MQIKAFSLTEQGSSHKKKNKECQDASKHYCGDNYGIAVVCDGHGGDDYIRSAIGSEKASQIAINSIRSFILEVEINNLKNHFDEVLNRLESSIISEWRQQVNDHWDSNPITELEKSVLSDKAKKRYLENHRIESAYGTTLIAVVLTSNYWFCFQIGDGKCVWVDQDSKFEQLPLDKRCFLNATTSLCDSDALEHFQTYHNDQLPAAVFIGSDGVDDCFKNDSQLYNFYKTVCYSFGTNDFNSAKDELKDFLPRLSQKGSGDDISIAAVLNMDILPRITAVTSFNRDDEKAKKQQAEEIEAKRNEELKLEYEKKAEEARLKREEEARRNQESRLNQITKELEVAKKQFEAAKINYEKAVAEKKGLLAQMNDAAGELLNRLSRTFNQKTPGFTKSDNEYNRAKANYEKAQKRYDETVRLNAATCPNCKRIIPVLDKFCRHCGTDMSLIIGKASEIVQNVKEEHNDQDKNREILKDNDNIQEKSFITETEPLERFNGSDAIKEPNLKKGDNELESLPPVAKGEIIDNLNKTTISSQKDDVDSSDHRDDKIITSQAEEHLQESTNSNHMPTQEEATKKNSNSASSNNIEKNCSEPKLTNNPLKTEYFSYTHKEYLADENGEEYLEDHVNIIRQEEPLS